MKFIICLICSLFFWAGVFSDLIDTSTVLSIPSVNSGPLEESRAEPRGNPERAKRVERIDTSTALSIPSVNSGPLEESRAEPRGNPERAKRVERVDYRRDLTALDYLNIAALFKESGETEKALEVLNKVKANFSQNYEFNSYLARLNYLLSRPQEAREILQGLKKKTWIDLVYLGLVYEDLGQMEKAKQSYHFSLSRKPNSLALFRLGKISRRQGDYQEAIKYFLSLIKLDASIRLAYCYLADCFLKQAQYSQAYQYLSKAINFYPQSKVISADLEKTKQSLGKSFFTAKNKLKEKERKKARFPAYLPHAELPFVSVGLAIGLADFSFSSGGEFTISDGTSIFKAKPDQLYTIALNGESLILKGYKDDTILSNFSGQLKIHSLGKDKEKNPFYLLDITYGAGDFWHKTIDRAYRGEIEVLVKKGSLTLINRLSIEEYLYGVLAAEIPPNSPFAALKSQAVAARTIAFKNLNRHKKDAFDFCADVHCQVYQGVSAETEATIKAVESTRGEVLTYNSAPIESFYHSNCGGCLAANVFGKLDYLTTKMDARSGSLPDSAYAEEQWFLNSQPTFCASSTTTANYRWQRIYDWEDFQIVFTFKLQDLKDIIPKEKGDCFHYKAIDVITNQEKKVLSGDLAIRNYFDKLRSSAFKVEIKVSPENTPELLIFWGAGFGHGTGLCQEGAISMAKENYTYQQILKHYYPKTSLKKLY